jgi:hypothetical protein
VNTQPIYIIGIDYKIWIFLGFKMEPQYKKFFNIKSTRGYPQLKISPNEPHEIWCISTTDFETTVLKLLTV